MNTHVVTKTLPKGETVLDVGTEVDASEWKFRKSLEEQRYIRPIQPDERKRMGRKDKENGNTGD